MEIQDLNQDEVELLTELQPTDWDDITPFFDFYIKSDFCYSIKVTKKNKIVGIGATVIHNDVAWLAHIIVHRGFRKRGIGQLITQTLVDYSRGKKCQTIYLIATDLGAPVYEKVGFGTETEYLFYLDLKSNNSRTSSNNISLITADLQDQIAQIDQQVSGEDRLIHLTKHLYGGNVYKKDNIVEGFYLPSFGEGLIIANTHSAGIELMKLRMSTKKKCGFSCR